MNAVAVAVVVLALAVANAFLDVAAIAAVMVVQQVGNACNRSRAHIQQVTA